MGKEEARQARANLLIKGMERVIQDFFMIPVIDQPEQSFIIEVALTNLLAHEQIRRALIERDQGHISSKEIPDYLSSKFKWIYDRLLDCAEHQLKNPLKEAKP